MAGAWVIDIGRVREDSENPRKQFDDQNQRDLVESIRQSGQNIPIEVWYVAKDDCYQIISGHRRYRACRELGLATIRCIEVKPPEDKAELSPRETLIRQLVENWQREDIDVYDLSDALVKLRDQFGYKQREIAEMIGKRETEVSRLLSLQEIAPDVRESVKSGDGPKLSRRHLMAVASVADPYRQRAIVSEIRAGNLTAIETERKVAEQIRSRRTGGHKPLGSPITLRHYTTSRGRVTVSFRRKVVTAEDVVVALAEALDQAREKCPAESSNVAE